MSSWWSWLLAGAWFWIMIGSLALVGLGLMMRPTPGRKDIGNALDRAEERGYRN